MPKRRHPTFVGHPGEWDGTGAAVLVLPTPSVPARRNALRALVARAVGVAPDAVAIEHRDGHPPRLAAPSAPWLKLSSASRGPLAAVALAHGPVGIDVEVVEPGMEPPWNVLHPAEARRLRAEPAGERPRLLARLWSVKEAYLKALELGLMREPSLVEVEVLDHDCAAVRDPAGPGALADTIWHRYGRVFAVSAVLLP